MHGHQPRNVVDILVGPWVFQDSGVNGGMILKKPGSPWYMFFSGQCDAYLVANHVVDEAVSDPWAGVEVLCRVEGGGERHRPVGACFSPRWDRSRSGLVRVRGQGACTFMKECMQDMLFQKKVLEDELEPVKLHNEALLLDAQDAGRDKKRRWQEARITSKYLASSLNSCVYKPCMFARVSEVNPPPPPRPPAAGSSEVNPPPPPVAPAEGGSRGIVGSWQHHHGGWKPKAVAMAGAALQT